MKVSVLIGITARGEEKIEGIFETHDKATEYLHNTLKHDDYLSVVIREFEVH